MEAYTRADLEWLNKKSRSSVEKNDKSSRTANVDGEIDISDYDVIFLGFPIWWYDAPRIIATFLESYDFSGKVVIPFATSGGSGMGNIDNNLKKYCSKDTVWKTGKKLSSMADKSTLEKWISSIDI